ncbi:MAG: XdhC family protein [SAR202 cluster bacterium]|jgi:xanthine dehydrogenase accessory factor|nr:XdhC family protein [SAR202 cluster bacterium]|tara:strand:- start:343 stop:1500 length:1158 start_codon:yes stop_codon:yes gene_type:complete
MQEVFHEAVNRLEKGESVVVATVIRTKGSTPQKPGAKLLVRQDGTGAGTLGGGCVEGDIWFAAKQLMQQGGEAEYREYELNEELAAEDGLVCGGTMYFLIDPVYTPEDYLPYAREIDFAYKGEGAVALATVIKSGNDGKSRIGDKLFIRENGKTEGTLGNLETDKGAIEKAKILMIHGRNEYVMTASGAEYFIEAYTTPPQLVICGGGHVSRALASLAKPLEFRLFITDDREEFANKDRFPEADIIVSEKPEDALPNLPINPNTFIVVATRGHRYDNTALLAAAKTPARYVGLMGSKRKTILIYEDLMRSDLSLDRIREIRSPIGLDIKARTPEEIAISIMSEILMFRLGGSGLPMKLDEKQLDRINKKISEEDSKSKVTPIEAV